MKNDAKFEEELTCHFKTDMRNLTNFDPNILKVSKIFTLMRRETRDPKTFKWDPGRETPIVGTGMLMNNLLA